MRIDSTFTLCIALCIAACGGERQTAGDPAPTLVADAPQPLNVLVIGGTSGCGLETVELALERGHRVTAMSRNPDRLEIAHERLDTLAADILDADAVTAAVAGHDAVIVSIGIGLTRKPVSVFSEGTANVLAAMADAGPRRLIVVTGIGAGDSRGHGGFFYERIFTPLFLKTNYADKDRQEALVRASHLDWTIVRPGFLNNDGAEKQYRVVEDLSGVMSGNISRADVGHFIVAALESDSYKGATVLLSN